MSGGVLEEIVSRLSALERAIASLAEQVRAPAPTGPDPSIWADGAMRVNDAAEFSGLSRTVLYGLMRSGELPYAQPTRDRVVPRRALVKLLESKQHDASREG